MKLVKVPDVTCLSCVYHRRSPVGDGQWGFCAAQGQHTFIDGQGQCGYRIPANAETLAKLKKLAEIDEVWDPIIEEQRRIQGDRVMDLIDAAARAEEVFHIDELDTGRRPK